MVGGELWYCSVCSLHSIAISFGKIAAKILLRLLLLFIIDWQPGYEYSQSNIVTV